MNSTIPSADTSPQTCQELVKSDFNGTEPVTLFTPALATTPLVFSCPHAGRHYPSRFLAMSRLNRHEIRRSEDRFVDQLFASAFRYGAPFVCANFPRAYIDANRSPLELDPAMFDTPVPPNLYVNSTRVSGGLGVVPKLVGNGQPIYRRRINLHDALARIALCYQPYHDLLGAQLKQTRDRFGFAVLIDCHSMPFAAHQSDAANKTDIIIGDRFSSSSSPGITQCVEQCLLNNGFRLRYNNPYAGGFITQYYGRPDENIHAVQLELCRSLYMNEREGRKNNNFETLRTRIEGVISQLANSDFSHLHNTPMAAE